MTDYISRDEAVRALEIAERNATLDSDATIGLIRAQYVIQSLPAATPELGRAKLEWNDRRQGESWGYFESPQTKFYIWINSNGGVRLEHSGCEDNCEFSVKCASFDKAKALAERLQFVLDSAREEG